MLGVIFFITEDSWRSRNPQENPYLEEGGDLMQHQAKKTLCGIHPEYIFPL